MGLFTVVDHFFFFFFFFEKHIGKGSCGELEIVLLNEVKYDLVRREPDWKIQP